MTGIMRSSTIASGRCFCAIATPRRPSSASRTSCPIRSRLSRRSDRTSGSSSITSTRAMPAPPPSRAPGGRGFPSHRVHRQTTQPPGYPTTRKSPRRTSPERGMSALTCWEALPSLVRGKERARVLKVSQKLEYAMRAMIELAVRRDDDHLVPAREIAENQQVPLRFLEQQLGALARAGLVESFRGAGGGCRIARDPAEITVAQIADAIEGQIYPVFCLEPSDHTCFADSRCGLQGFWADVARAVQQVFEETTVADLAARHRKMSPGRVMVSPEALVSRLN